MSGRHLQLVADSGQLAPRANAERIRDAFLSAHPEVTSKAYAGDLRAWWAWLERVELPSGAVERHVDPVHAAREHVDLWVRSMEGTLAPATIARRLATLQGFYVYARHYGGLERTPMDGVGVRRPRVGAESPNMGLDADEIAAMLAHVERAVEASTPAQRWRALRDRALVVLLALNGLRISEALGADVGDLGAERGHRTLRLHRKGGKEQRCALAPRTHAALAELVAAAAHVRTRDEQPIFVTSTGGRMDRQAAHKLISRVALAAGIPHPVSPHSLRHGYVTAALDSGAELRDVQDSAAHADPRTTRRYDRGREALDRHPTYAVAEHIENPPQRQMNASNEVAKSEVPNSRGGGGRPRSTAR